MLMLFCVLRPFGRAILVITWIGVVSFLALAYVAATTPLDPSSATQVQSARGAHDESV